MQVIEFDWQEAGPIGLSPSRKLAFPVILPEPGIYRFRVPSVARSEVYSGESENLRQRMEHNYRYHPGPTNVRVRAWLLGDLWEGRSIQLAIARSSFLEIDGERVIADLTKKQVRLLIENAALAVARRPGEQIQHL
jgi:hypothetical protein